MAVLAVRDLAVPSVALRCIGCFKVAAPYEPMADPDHRSLLPASLRGAFLSTLHEQLIVRSAGFFNAIR
jgi:hypothetical protein